MSFLIQFIQNATDIYSLILVAFALLSWFPNAYDTPLAQFLTTLVNPILKPLRRLPLQIAGLDFSVWVAILLVHIIGRYAIRLLVFIL